MTWLLLFAILLAFHTTWFLAGDIVSRLVPAGLLGIAQLALGFLILGEPVPDSRGGALLWLAGVWAFAVVCRALYLQALDGCRLRRIFSRV